MGLRGAPQRRESAWMKRWGRTQLKEARMKQEKWASSSPRMVHGLEPRGVGQPIFPYLPVTIKLLYCLVGCCVFKVGFFNGFCSGRERLNGWIAEGLAVTRLITLFYLDGARRTPAQVTVALSRSCLGRRYK